MDTTTAIDIMARWALWQAFEMWTETEEGIGEGCFPTVDEDDIGRIIERMETLMPRDITLGQFQLALLALSTDPKEER